MVGYIEDNIKVSELPAQGLADFVFDVGFGKYRYRVSFSAEYFRKLTGGKATASELVKKTFEFLLKREGPESILKQFELQRVSQHFPDYPYEMQKVLAS
ncbi:MAG TPA: hypothetical protein VFK11_05060 [Candidatus Saccharimonadales bacterium]|nr:hypothetical protein [Candidatus Saccharimonadales bacterium]